MKLVIENWLDSQQFDQETDSCFNESIACYKVGAHKAALLFAYLSFAGALRARIIFAQPPTGFSIPLWTNIQNNVRQAETWDKAVFTTTQQKQPGQVFVISDDLRFQISYWKDRRNDCAHSKSNKITAAHVEAFYAFIESNLGKLAVNGSRPAMLVKIINHYNPSLTPPSQSIAPLIQEIFQAVAHAELNDFVADVTTAFDNNRTAIEAMLNQQSPNKLDFVSNCFQSGADELKDALVQYLIANIPALLACLRRNLSVQILNGRHPTIRQLWHDHLFSDNHNDFPIFAALVRNTMIPPDEVNEAMALIVRKPIGYCPNDVDSITLRQAGFFEALELAIIEPNQLASFGWANASKELIVKHLDEMPISRNVALAISQTFDAPYYPWHLCENLNSFFHEKLAKKQEFEAHLGGEPPVIRPSKINSLAAVQVP